MPRGAQFAGLSRGDRRALAFQAPADTLAQLSNTLFALKYKQLEEERKAAEKEQLSAKELLPLLRFQAQLQRWQQNDQRHAEERATDLQFRSQQAELAQRAADRQERAVADTAAYHQELKARGLPEYLAQKAALEAGARLKARNEAKLDEYVDVKDLPNIPGAKPGMKYRDLVQQGLSPETKKQQDAKVALAAKMALLDRYDQAVTARMAEPTPGSGKLRRMKDIAAADVSNLFDSRFDSDPEAMFLRQFPANLDKLRTVGGGQISDRDVARYAEGLPTHMITRSGALAASANLRQQLVSEAKGLGVSLDDVVNDAQHLRSAFETAPPPAAPTTTPTATTTTTSNPIPRSAVSGAAPVDALQFLGAP